MSATFPCSQIVPWLEAFVDGELPQEKMLDVGQHLSECSKCSEWVRFSKAVQHSTRRVVQRETTVDSAFSSRVQAALAAERASETEPSAGVLGAHDTEHTTSGPLSWRSTFFLAAAAVVTFVWVGTHRQPTPRLEANNTPAPTLANEQTDGLEEVLDKLIDYHSTTPSEQVTEPELVPQLERDVGVRVQLPVFSGTPYNEAQWQPHWHSATVVPVRNQRAAYLRYTISGHRVTVYVYNAVRVPLRNELEPRVVHDQPVYVGERRGYSIAAREQKGLGYAVATDLDGRESAELVASIH
jgi:negative regulator of sigma E activity